MESGKTCPRLSTNQRHVTMDVTMVTWVWGLSSAEKWTNESPWIAAARSATKTAQHICGGVGASCVIGAGVMVCRCRLTLSNRS
jgi:hypothetical protein